MSTAIVVLGNHRSGSSMVAGVLHHLGVSMGPTLYGPGPGNPAGHYEDAEFLALHQAIYGEFRPDGTIDPRRWQFPKPDVQRWDEAYRALVAARRDANAGVWGLKDPRLCFLLPLLVRSAAHAGVGLKFVHVRREWTAVARSLAARDGLDYQYAASVVHNYARALEAALPAAAEAGPVLTVAYDNVLADRGGYVRTLAYFAGVGAKARHSFVEAAFTIDPTLRHHEATR